MTVNQISALCIGNDVCCERHFIERISVQACGLPKVPHTLLACDIGSSQQISLETSLDLIETQMVHLGVIQWDEEGAHVNVMASDTFAFSQCVVILSRESTIIAYGTTDLLAGRYNVGGGHLPASSSYDELLHVFPEFLSVGLSWRSFGLVDPVSIFNLTATWCHENLQQRLDIIRIHQHHPHNLQNNDNASLADTARLSSRAAVQVLCKLSNGNTSHSSGTLLSVGDIVVVTTLAHCNVDFRDRAPRILKDITLTLSSGVKIRPLGLLYDPTYHTGEIQRPMHEAALYIIPRNAMIRELALPLASAMLLPLATQLIGTAYRHRELQLTTSNIVRQHVEKCGEESEEQYFLGSGTSMHGGMSGSGVMYGGAVCGTMQGRRSDDEDGTPRRIQCWKGELGSLFVDSLQTAAGARWNTRVVTAAQYWRVLAEGTLMPLVENVAHTLVLSDEIGHLASTAPPSAPFPANAVAGASFLPVMPVNMLRSRSMLQPLPNIHRALRSTPDSSEYTEMYESGMEDSVYGYGDYEQGNTDIFE